MSETASQQAAPEPVVAAPQAVTDAPVSTGPVVTPLRAQLSRSASAMGNRAFTHWARGAGAAGEPLPTSSARELWGPILAREPATAGEQATEEEEADEPIVIKALKFGKDTLDGEIPATGGDLSKTFNTHLGKSAKFGPYSLQVPLFPLIVAGFGAGGAMSAKADASLKLSGTNIASAAFGQAKKQHVTASGTGTASGTIAASLVAGIKFGVAGLANVGLYGQGTLAFRADGDAKFDGSISRLKAKKGGSTWGAWTGAINFKANIKGSLIAEAQGYFEYQVLWIFRDQFGKFKIGKWTLAEAGLDLTGTLGPGKPLDVSVKPWVGQLMKPGVTEEIRKRTQAEREMAEKLAQAGAAGAPVARKVLRAADDEPPPPEDGAPPAEGADAGPPEAPQAEPAAETAGGQQGGAAAPVDNAQLAAIAGVQPGAPTVGGPGSFTLDSEPKIEE
ncbi:MAG TPA: hypothetical protein VFZ00_32270 [Solirubrobacter sp.]|nr:hypothetical protein [Solirubrobacter sp.]